jgi:hypothetical protein
MADKTFRPEMENEPPSFTEGQEERIGMLGKAFVRSMRRFKYFVGAAILLLAVGNGYVVWAVKEQARNICIERNERSRSASEALGRLAEAHRLDGNTHASAVWQSYLDAAKKNPLPPC